MKNKQKILYAVYKGYDAKIMISEVTPYKTGDIKIKGSVISADTDFSNLESIQELEITLDLLDHREKDTKIVHPILISETVTLIDYKFEAFIKKEEDADLYDLILEAI